MTEKRILRRQKYGTVDQGLFLPWHQIVIKELLETCLYISWTYQTFCGVVIGSENSSQTNSY